MRRSSSNLADLSSFSSRWNNTCTPTTSLSSTNKELSTVPTRDRQLYQFYLPAGVAEEDNGLGQSGTHEAFW